MTLSNDRIVLLIDGPQAHGVYLVEAPSDEATKTRLDGDVHDCVAALEGAEQKVDWRVHDVAEALERKDWSLSWVDLLEVAVYPANGG